MLARLAAVAAALAAGALAECPNACSRHGECGSKDQCLCEEGYFGSDCSMRVCPVGAAYVDSPAGDLNHNNKVGYGASALSYSKVQWAGYKQPESWPSLAKTSAGYSRTADGSVDRSGANTVGGWAAQAGEAHFLTECSGVGSCDHKTGTCNCPPGYTGAACQRTTCPNDCSGNGVCRTVAEIARGALTAFSTDGKGVSVPFEYSLWDADKNRACVCDPGFHGPDCSLRSCPAGDDPLTTQEFTCGNQPCQKAQQSFSVDGGQGNGATKPGTYYLDFTTAAGRTLRTREFALYTDNTVVGWPNLQAANEAAIKAALEALPNNATGTVTVTSGKLYGRGGSTAREQLRFTVEFTARAGPVAPLKLGWKGTSNAATRASFIFQGHQPVQVLNLLPIAGAGSERIRFQIFPQDQSQAGRSEYWLGTTVDLGVTVNGVSYTLSNLVADAQGPLADKLAEALNNIPYIKMKYGKPFQRDATVIVSQPAGTGNGVQVLVAFPDLNTGANKLQYAFSKDPANMGSYSAAIRLSDVRPGTEVPSACSNRGTCDESTGQCICFAGYQGSACSQQNVLARGPTSA